MIQLQNGQFGWDYYMVYIDHVSGKGEATVTVLDEHNSRYAQTDMDRMNLASAFGWYACHNQTDGSIDCPDCGRTVAEFMSEVSEWLDDHIGDIVDDPGYFFN